MKTTPFEHQRVDYEASRDQIGYGVYWEMGLGKSKLIIDTSCYLHKHDLIDGVLVIAPKGVHTNFLRQEMPVHCWDDVHCRGFTWDAGSSGTKRGLAEIAAILEPQPGILDVVVMNYEALRTERGFAFAKKFLETHRVMMVLDESTAIASPSAIQSKRCHLLAPLAAYRRVCSGTPIADGPFDIYSQMKFVDPAFWKEFGLASYWVFKQSFANFAAQRASQGHAYQQLLGYRDLERLQRIVATRSTRRLKEDVLDLPPKLYTKLEFDLTPAQRAAYDDLRSIMFAELESGMKIEAPSALIKLMRLQQLTSGFAVAASQDPLAPGDGLMWNTPELTFMGEVIDVVDGRIVAQGERLVAGVAAGSLEVVIEPDDLRVVRLTESKKYTVDVVGPEDNPRLQLLQTFVEPIRHKVIVWGKFTRDVDNMMNLLGKRAVRYDGQTRPKDREQSLERFRHDPEAQFFVANPAAISMGVTLTQAKTVIYYSNDFQLQRRLQSEDRAHRIGQDQSVLVVDIVARNTVDEKVYVALRKKFDIAALVNGDRFREWIS